MLNPSPLERHSLFLCAFRPLFLAAALYGAIGLAVWMAALYFGLALPAVPGGPLVWHAHELIFGFGLAATAGFVLTAVPEFTGTAPFSSRMAIAITLWWLIARLAFWTSGTFGPWPAALSNAGLAILLPALLGARLLREPERRNVAFLWGLAALATAATGFHVDTLIGAQPIRWLHAAIDVMMILIVVAMSRVSMRIVNDALDAARASSNGDDVPEYLARPPRRNLAVFTIALHAAAGFAAPESATTGWLALACAAALLNLLNDWHVGRPLFGRWPSMLYAVYWLMALGYAAMGVARLFDVASASAGRHLLTAGAMGLSIFAVLSIAGRIHSGQPLDRRPWVPIGAALLAIAALARAAVGLPGAPGMGLMWLSAIGWIGAYGLAIRHLGPLWVRPRADGGNGCDEWADPGAMQWPAQAAPTGTPPPRP